MFTPTPYKDGTKARFRFGEHARKEAIVLSRRKKDAPEAAVEYAHQGDGPQIWPGPDVWSWRYRVRLCDTNEEVDADHEELENTPGTEWENDTK